MDFEAMQVIWDSQNDRPLYAIDQTALDASVRKKTRWINRCVITFDVMIMAATLGTSIILIVDAIMEGNSQSQFVLAGCLFAAFLYTVAGQVRRLRRERGFEPTLLGELNKAIAQVDYYIGRLKTLRWWLILPITAGVLIALPFYYQHKPGWFWALFLLGLAFVYWQSQRELRRDFLPKKRALESLRDKLVAADN